MLNVNLRYATLHALYTRAGDSLPRTVSRLSLCLASNSESLKSGYEDRYKSLPCLLRLGTKCSVATVVVCPEGVRGPVSAGRGRATGRPPTHVHTCGVTRE